MNPPTYTPRAGSLASQVIGFFRHIRALKEQP